MVKININSPNQKFGNKIISMKYLYKYKLQLRYNNYTRIKKYDRIPISETLMKIILEIIYDSKFNYQLIQQLSLEELTFFEKMIQDTGHYITMQYDISRNRDTGKELVERYKILAGQIASENDSPEILEEMQELSYKLYQKGLLSRNQLIKNLNNSL